MDGSDHVDYRAGIYTPRAADYAVCEDADILRVFVEEDYYSGGVLYLGGDEDGNVRLCCSCAERKEEFLQAMFDNSRLN